MLPTPHSATTPVLTVVGRSLGGRPRTYRLERPVRSDSLAAACRRRLVGALLAAGPSGRAAGHTALSGRLAPAA